MRPAPILALAACLLAAGCSSTTAPPGRPNRTPTPGGAKTRSAHFVISAAGFQLPAPVQREVAEAAGNSIVLAGGLDSAGASTDGVFSLDPQNGHVSQLGTVPGAFHDAAGAMLGNKLMVFGGGAVVGTDHVQAFDLGARHGSLVGHLPVALSDVSSATIGSMVYLVGGYDGHTPQSAIYATTNGTSFRRVGSMPAGLRYTAVTAVDGSVVIAGGTTGTTSVNTVNRLDPATGHVTLLAHLPAPVAHAAAFVLGGEIYVVGGQDPAGNAVRTVTRIDPSTGTVTRLKPLAQPVSDAGVAELNDQAWLIGGWRGSTVSQILVARLAHHPA
jgi:N-acetylneuraminic acid mutarotase